MPAHLLDVWFSSNTWEAYLWRAPMPSVVRLARHLRVEIPDDIEVCRAVLVEATLRAMRLHNAPSSRTRS